MNTGGPRYIGVLATLLLCRCALADAQMATLVLHGGAGVFTRLPREPIDMQLQIGLDGEKWDARCWGNAYWFNRGEHRGQVTIAAGKPAKLSVKLAVAADPLIPGGQADYAIELNRSGDDFSGTYNGTFLGAAVRGQVTGRVAPDPVRTVPGFGSVETNEHPRLIFRRRDLPLLRKRMQTPEGKAIVEMMLSRSPVRQLEQVGDRRASWLAASYGVVWQLTGDRVAADKAREILVAEVFRKPMPTDRHDVHLAPRLLGLALAYDLCYDAWDAEFVALAGNYLHDVMMELYGGTNEAVPIEMINPHPWTYRNAMRMGSIGCAAIALLGEKDANGRPIEQAAHVADVAERQIVAYLKMGLSAGGMGMEGPLAKSMALSNGVLQFMHASRIARGRDLSAVNPMLLAGQVLEASSVAGPHGHDFGLSSISVQISGRWAMGLGTVPANRLAEMTWCFDRNAGPLGRKHYDCAYPFQAAYALMNYPFDVESSPPPENPPFLADRDHGHFIFRSGWKDADDVLTTLYARSSARRGIELPGAQRGRSTPPAPGEVPPAAMEMRIRGCGQEWMHGTMGIAPQNSFFGADVLDYQSPRPMQATLSADLDRMYLKQVVPDARPRRRTEPNPDTPYLVRQLAERTVIDPPPDPALFTDDAVKAFVAAPGAYRDVNVRGRRYIGIDYSGACGAPALLVVIDKIEGAAANMPWELGLGSRETPVVWKAGRFVLGDEAGANLSGQFVAPAGARAARIRAPSLVWVVFTLQRGAPPDISVQGQGARVTIGGQTVAFDGKSIVFGK